jgi:hypothetical protein
MSGTIIRLFSGSEKHYTGILLKDGRVLEVKNPDTGIKTMHDSVEVWKQTRHYDRESYDNTPISNTNGFHYPRENKDAYKWVQWCYSIVCEAAPQLLENEMLKIKYNKLVDKIENNTRIVLVNVTNRYSPDNLSWIQKYMNVYTEFIELFRDIIGIVEPHVKEYMAKKIKILETKKQIKSNQRRLRHFEKKVLVFNEYIRVYKEQIESNTKLVEELEEGLVKR